MASVIPFPAASNPLALLQGQFVLFKLSGKYWVVDRTELNAVKGGQPNVKVQFLLTKDARLMLERYLELQPIVSSSKIDIPQFYRDPGTIVYDAVAFSPLPTPSNTFNYWTGSPINPVAGDWSVIGKFLRWVICGGDINCLNYLLHYLAHMLQKPEEKPGVIVALLGGEGIGKGTFFRLLRAMFPATTVEISDVDQVVGKYNAVLEHNYCICMDEAVFSGDGKATDRLKSYVTEPTVSIEDKFQPRRTIDSFHRFFAASNHKHFARVSADDRRFVFFRVSGAHQGDLKYWEKVHAAIADSACIAAMVHYLLNMDLSAFNIRDRPKTAEHMVQKLQSLSGFDRYWCEILFSGDLGSVQWSASCFVSTDTLMHGWQAHNRPVRQFTTAQQRDIAEALERLCPAAKSRRQQSNGRQERGYQLPTLSDARRAFAAAMGGAIRWP